MGDSSMAALCYANPTGLILNGIVFPWNFVSNISMKFSHHIDIMQSIINLSTFISIMYHLH